MSTESRDIKIGSGKMFVCQYTGSIPPAASLETNTNLLGYIKDGAVVSYDPRYQSINNTDGSERKKYLISESITMRFGVINWRGEIFDTICNSASTVTPAGSTTTTTSIGGVENSSSKKYVVRFVHNDGEHRLTMVGTSDEGFQLQFQPGTATVVSATFKATPMDDGRYLLFEEGVAGAPTGTLEIWNPGSYNVSAYDQVIVHRNVAGTTATESDVKLGKLFWKPVDGGDPVLVPGSYEADDPAATLSVNSTDLADKTIGSTLYLATTNIPTCAVENGTTELRLPAAGFGDAEESDVILNKTFTSKEGIRKTGTLATTTQLTLQSTGMHNETSGGQRFMTGNSPTSGLISTGTTVRINLSGTGDATVADVRSMRSFTSASGFDIGGTMQDVERVLLDEDTWHETTRSGGHYIEYDGDIPVTGYLDTDHKVEVLLDESSFGDATEADVAAGKYFTSKNGLHLLGTGSGGGGGSLDTREYTVNRSSSQVYGSKYIKVTDKKAKLVCITAQPDAEIYTSFLACSMDSSGYYAYVYSTTGDTTWTSCTITVVYEDA